MQENGQPSDGRGLSRRQETRLRQQPSEWFSDCYPTQLGALLPEKLYYESTVSALFAARVAQDREKLEQITKDTLGRIALRNMTVQMDIAGQLDEIIRTQPTDELADMAEEIAAEELSFLRARLRDESHHTAADIRRMTREPLTRETRPYMLDDRNRRKLTWRQRLLGYL